MLFCIPKILKNESNSQLPIRIERKTFCCFVSQRYWKMKAIHNSKTLCTLEKSVVLYPKDTEKWKQFTTWTWSDNEFQTLFCIPKILKNESNSQQRLFNIAIYKCCFVSQRYWKMKAIHNHKHIVVFKLTVVLYPKDTEKWKQFTTKPSKHLQTSKLFCIPKILKNESNSQQSAFWWFSSHCCFVSQRYWKMKAIHNGRFVLVFCPFVVLYPKDTEKWKQFTTIKKKRFLDWGLFCIPKILKNESNSQQCSC